MKGRGGEVGRGRAGGIADRRCARDRRTGKKSRKRKKKRKKKGPGRWPEAELDGVTEIRIARKQERGRKFLA